MQRQDTLDVHVPPGTAGTWLNRHAILVLGALTAAVWATSVPNGFVFDDLQNITSNPWITDWRRLPEAFTRHAAGFDPRFDTSFYRPLMHVLYAIVYSAAGPRPWAFHALNLVLHGGAVLLVFVLTRTLVQRWSDPHRHVWLPLGAAAVFAVHPAHVEAVAWIAGITDLSYTVFGLTALLAYVRAFDRPSWSPLAAMLLFASLLSKETGIVFFLLFALLELIERQTRGSPVPFAVARLGAAVIAVFLYIAARFAALGGFAPSARSHPHTTVEIAATGASLFARYLLELFAPVRQSVLEAVPVQSGFTAPATLAGLVAAGTIVVLAISFRRRLVAALPLAVLALPLLPALYLPAIEGGGSLYGERYLYLPVLGVAWYVAAGVDAATRRVQRPRLVAAVAVAVVALSALAVIARTRVWKDSLTFWTAAVEQSPKGAQAHDGLCVALYMANRYHEAIEACTTALALDPRQMTARMNRATALLAIGDASTAAREFDAVIADRPDSVLAHVNRGLASMMLGQVHDALQWYARALELAPDNAEAHNNLGVALVRLGRAGEGCMQVREAVRLAPANAEYRANLDACSR